MLDKKRIRLMAKMAVYEKNDINKDLKISSYYRKDYTSLNTLITILWITIGYVIVAGLFVLCNLEALLENLTITKLIILGAVALGIYFVILIVYGICASSFYSAKHNSAKQRVKKYYRDLARLEKMDVKEKK